MLELKALELDQVNGGYVPPGLLTPEQIAFLNSLPDGTIIEADLFFPPSNVNTISSFEGSSGNKVYFATNLN